MSDAGIPPCSKTIVATVNVRRNLHDPSFKRGEWSVTIRETQVLTEAIMTIEAEDKDEKVTVLYLSPTAVIYMSGITL